MRERTRIYALIAWLAAAYPASSQLRQSRASSPEINPDRRVTFRLQAPNASQVKLWGEWITRANTVENLVRDSDGTWVVTVGPLDPGIYAYSFRVDGLRVLDPRNPMVKTGRDGADANLFEVSGNSPAFYNPRAVPQGTVHLHAYESSTGLGQRRVVVYTPADYLVNRRARYPVLYLLHGSGDTETGWTDVGRAHVIADNLIAEKRARPMIIVMPQGHSAPPGRPEENPMRNGELVEQDLLTDVLPLVEKVYRVEKRGKERGIAGLSMGGFQALAFGLKHPDKFHHIGIFSAGVYGMEGEKQLLDSVRLRKLASPSGLFWIGIGDRDFLLKNAQRLDAMLTEQDIKHDYMMKANAGHTWLFWRECLVEFLPKLFRE